MREVTITPASAAPAANELSGENLAQGYGAVAISKSVRQGDLSALNDGSTATSLDDSDEDLKRDSWWGYTWPQELNINQALLTSGGGECGAPVGRVRV